MKIGQSITLTAYSVEHASNQVYRCKVIDKNEKYIYIDLPVHVETKKTKVMAIGTTIVVEYIGHDQSVYRFKTEIVDRKSGTIPTLVLKQPEKENMERIQRRKFVRVKTAADIAVHSRENKFAPFTTVTVDLSGGGLSFIVPIGIQIDRKDQVDIHLVLIQQTGDYSYLDLQGEVVRVVQHDTSVEIASVKLVSLDEADKQSIIQYCFEKLREARQKELR